MRKGLNYSSEEDSEEKKPCKEKRCKSPRRCERGERGEKGDRGCEGKQGPEGRRGAQGPPGIQGMRGPTGPRGDQGGRGLQGPIGPAGPRGEKGDRGERGAQGSRGERGEMGPRGAQGNEGKRGPMGCQGEKGKQGATGATGRGSTGATGATGPGGGTVFRCIPIRFSGWAGETIIKTPPRDSKDNIQLDVYYLDCKADLFISTGSDINGGWATFDSPNAPYYYYQVNGTPNLVCPGATGVSGSTGITGCTGITGATGYFGFPKQIWYVVPNPDPTSPVGGTITPITSIFRDLKNGDKIFDSCSGKLLELVNCSWECCGRMRGEKLNCINIQYKGFGGLSVPRDQDPPVIGVTGIYFLDYGGVNHTSADADLWISTGDVYQWQQVPLFPNPENPQPYFYFEILNGPCPFAANASILSSSGGTSTLGITGPVEGIFAVGQFINREDTTSNLGTIVALGPGTSGKAGTYILNQPNGVTGPFPVTGNGQIPCFTSENTGRIWYVEPVEGSQNTFNGKARQYQQLCNLQPGDQVIDSGTGNLYTLFCDADTNCYWTCSPILPCSVVDGTCPTNCGVTGTINLDIEAPCCNLRGPPGPTGPAATIKTGCIAYSGFCGDSPPGASIYPAGSFFLETSDADLYVSVGFGVPLQPFLMSGPDPYIYFCIETGKLYNVVPQPSPTSTQPGCVYDIGTQFGLVNGTKFIDCCSGCIYTLNNGIWTTFADFPLGVTGGTGCTGGTFFVPGGTGATGCCNFGGNGGNGFTCIPSLSASGLCAPSINFCPSLTPANGTYLLTLNNGTTYQWNSGLNNWVHQAQFTDYYYLCTESFNGCTGVTGPPFQIYYVVGNGITAPVKIQDELGLKVGANLLVCATSTLYELTTLGWVVCCQLSTSGATGTTGPTGPTGALGPTGPAAMIKSGCIAYSGFCGDSPPQASIYPAGSLFLETSDADLYISVGFGVPLAPFLLSGPPYIYYCIETGKLYNVIPQPEPTSTQPGCVFDIGTAFGLINGTKFIDCCSGCVYTLTNGVWSSAPDFPLGITGATGIFGGTGCTGTFIFPGITGATGCCDLGRGGDFTCIPSFGATGLCAPSLNFCPSLTSANGTFLLTLNNGTAYQWNSGLNNWVHQAQLTNYYYLCTQSFTGCTGMTGPPFQIYYVVGDCVTAPVKVQDRLNLGIGASLLVCATSTIYELTATGWVLCCSLSTGVTGPTGAVGPTGPASGFTGPTGPTGSIGPTGPPVIVTTATLNAVTGRNYSFKNVTAPPTGIGCFVLDNPTPLANGSYNFFYMVSMVDDAGIPYAWTTVVHVSVVAGMSGSVSTVTQTNIAVTNSPSITCPLTFTSDGAGGLLVTGSDSTRTTRWLLTHEYTAVLFP